MDPAVEKPSDESSEQLVATTTPNKVDHPPEISKPTDTFSVLVLQPLRWLQMLSSKLNPSFIFGVILIYGIGQGFSGSFFRLVTDYYWKDVQKVQPSVVQLYMGLYYIPWIMKPIWGILTDVFTVRGYRRRPYFLLAGVVGTVSSLMVALNGKLSAALALVCLVGVSAALAVADVTIDACIARYSIEMRSLATDLQSLCSFCLSAGALVGFSTSGFFVHHLGAQGALGLLAISPVLVIGLGFMIYEERITSLRSEKKKSVEKLLVAIRGMYKTIKFPQVWKPSLYIYLSLALSLSAHEGQFYWCNGFHSRSSNLPQDSERLPFRTLIFYAQLLYSISGLFDLVFVFRWNLSLGIPDSFFIIMEECVHTVVGKIRWMPMIVLSTRLCPLGIEGTFFALLMCIDSLGSLSAKWGGGVLLHALHVTRTDFSNLWLVLFIRKLLRFSTLGLIFLVPNADQSDVLVPRDLLTVNTSTIDVDHESLELVPRKERVVLDA
ncbi:hypothetical protein FNV43_RR11353 [Rhamnella rubrinervis]|uniref:Folate-biopterin transporter 6 n=1 Tax=Rhamnella rubrinervis TaxID=2594499 RepID=A0A8K0H5Z0_9ROSA|nr:hypothetical protein FNV43_RR11353 [Rhamnella rubrinervis]